MTLQQLHEAIAATLVESPHLADCTVWIEMRENKRDSPVDHIFVAYDDDEREDTGTFYIVSRE